jgi:TFIIF-interacting CTD phosphatase-like protein
MLNAEHTYIQEIYSRQDCTQIGNFFVKDLSILGTDLSRTVILDDSLISFAYHLDNGILIEAWNGNSHDMCLLRLTPFLNELSEKTDVRKHLQKKIGISRFFAM